MTIFFDLDGVLRRFLPDWKAAKHFLSYSQYLERAGPIKENIEFALNLKKQLEGKEDVFIATKCRYELLNLIWLEEYGVEIPILHTGNEKIEFLAERFELSNCTIFDDSLETIEEAKKAGMTGIYVPTNSLILDSPLC